MKFLKNIKLYFLCISFLLIPIFLTSSYQFSSHNSIARELSSIDTTQTDDKSIPSKPSPTGVNDPSEEEELNDMFFGGFDFKDAPQYTPTQLIRYSSNSSRKIGKEKAALDIIAKKNLEEATKTLIIENSHNIELQINEMIKLQSINLSNNEINFLYLMENLSPIELNSNLAQMTSIHQIQSFRDITNNFTDSSKLESYAILYLNACAEFYPIAQAMKDQVALNPIEVNITATLTKYITEFDFFHVFIGEMDYIDNMINSASILKGGHLYIPSLTPRTRLFESYEYDEQSGCFNLGLRSITTAGKAFKTYYPYGKTPDECLDQLRSMIKAHNKKALTINLSNFDDTSNSIKIIGTTGNTDATTDANIDITLYINPLSGIATFFPMIK